MKLINEFNASLPSMSPASDDDSTSSASSFTADSSSVDDGSDVHTSATVQPHTGYKKVLVTGGAGFIGSHVAEYLLARGDDVVIVDELNDYYDVHIKQSNLDLLRAAYPDEKRLKIYGGDICDEDLMLDVFERE